ncbi:ARM repeat-containing protein [Russula earlei]|uniref:ARM repeat-containing protein n=1 Tax=Russula earlei TaxID=71964 RepID=A0ACC0UCM9_9AGAM|nr:ARM repeat-containing protein [Russula earlei]
MEVPFISSGALSRAHYIIVRKVELAQTAQQADDYFLEEVAALRDRLSRPGFSSAQCREYLIMLLYCSMNTVAGLPPDALEFALPYAVNLAEAGSSFEDRKTGYLFCSEIMSPHHDLKLMLVNTIRKDLEADSTMRIVLALNYLIQCPSEDVIPAVQARLHGLLSHKSPRIRRRALHAARSLSECDPAALRWLSPEISRCLRDTDKGVVGSSLANGLLGPDTLGNAYQSLVRFEKSSTSSPAAMLVTQKALRLYSIVQPSKEVLKVVVGLIKRSANITKAHVLLYDCFSVLRNTPADILIPFTTSNGSPVSHIRHLLSNDQSEQHLFLSCLSCLPPAVWAGTIPDVPAVLEAWEVDRVMRLLSTPDPAIWLKTLRVLTNVDPSIVELYFSQKLGSLDRSAASCEDEVLALLEVITILAGDDAELYARSIRDVISPASTRPDAWRSSQVLERAVETVLSSLRDGEATFGENVATTLLTPLAEVEAETSFTPTLMVVLTALACEYAGRVPVSPVQLLCGLSRRLISYPASIQEVGLLAMMRLAAECQKIPPETISHIQHLRSTASRHISRFEDMARKPDELKAAVANSRSRSLPDFLLALESKSPAPPSSPHINSSSRAESRSSFRGAQKLRYTAYEPPPPSQPRRSRATSSTRSIPTSDSHDDLARTVTAGDLAIAAGSPELRALSLPQYVRSPPGSPVRNPTSISLLSPRADLISLDVPFIAEQPDDVKVSEQDEQNRDDFANVWDTASTFSARGWCDETLEAVVRRLQGLGFPRGLAVLPADRPPFQGELKILVLGGPDGRGRAVLRLHEERDNDEDGCLWRMRSDDEGLLVAVKQVLSG